MCCSIARACVFAALLTVSSLALPQEFRVIRVGVPVMKNNASRAFPGTQARDRLVKSFNDEKPDKKLHVRVQGVALDGTSPDEIVSQGVAKNCDYVVYTTLIELRTQGDPAERRPGTIEINPGAKRGAQDPESAAMNPEYEATVEYKLYRTGDPSAISGAPFSTQKAMSEINAVSQVMDRIANSVFADAKKDIAARQ
jgi:hypothetical protein